MTRLRVIIMFAAAFILQLTLAGIISINNVGPNLILSLTVVIIFVFEEGWRCFPYAAATALLLDICSGTVIGASSLSITAASLIAVLARKMLNTDVAMPMLVTGAVCTLLYNVIYWTVMRISGDPMTVIFMLKYQIFYIMYNVVIVYVLFRSLDKLRIRREKEEDELDI